MFFHPDDIRWFMPVKLWTKLGLKGQIDEPLGTKGHFKCSFSGFLKHHDTICMSLYKRQFPPFNPEWFEGSS
jgi:pre-rRNA-processing protein TSR1